MSDFLCPNCGPISEETGTVTDEEGLACAGCLCPEDRMAPLVDAYEDIEKRLSGWKTRCEQLFDRLDEEVNARLKYQLSPAPAAVPEVTEKAVQMCYDSLYNADGEDPYPEEHKRLIRAHWGIMRDAINAAPAEPNNGEQR